jgi:hypothetical protein
MKLAQVYKTGVSSVGGFSAEMIDRMLLHMTATSAHRTLAAVRRHPPFLTDCVSDLAVHSVLYCRRPSL